MIAALFDVEGTLYTAQMARGLLRYARDHGSRSAANRYYLSVLPMFGLRKLKLVSDEGLRRTLISRLAGIVKGWTADEGRAAFDWIIHDWLLPATRSDVMARWRDHRAKGHALVLVSGMPMPCLERLGAMLGAAGVVGTAIELQDGRYTGRSILPVMVGDDKAAGTRALFAGTGAEVDWQASFAYGDSIHDQSIFHLVGHPVAVYPDPELLALAQKKGWDVIGA